MKIKVTKDKDDIITNLVIDGEEIQFDYVRLINGLYDNDIIDDIVFSDDIEEWEREEIRKLIDDINKAIIKQDEEDTTEEADDVEDVPF